MTYSYDPLKIKARGKDQMRFELGDTLVDGGADTCALADEEYTAMLEGLKDGTKAWKFAKLAVLEAIYFKMSYDVTTKIDVLQYNFGERAERWKALYDELRKQILAAASIPTLAPSIEHTPPYFHTEMEKNIRNDLPYTTYIGKGRDLGINGGFPFRKITE